MGNIALASSSPCLAGDGQKKGFSSAIPRKTNQGQNMIWRQHLEQGNDESSPPLSLTNECQHKSFHSGRSFKHHSPYGSSEICTISTRCIITVVSTGEGCTPLTTLLATIQQRSTCSVELPSQPPAESDLAKLPYTLAVKGRHGAPARGSLPSEETRRQAGFACWPRPIVTES